MLQNLSYATLFDSFGCFGAFFFFIMDVFWSRDGEMMDQMGVLSGLCAWRESQYLPRTS